MSKKKKDSDNIEKWIEHGTDIENCTLFLSGEVDDSMADRCITAFHLFDPNKPALVLLNSVGGSEIAGLAIYDTLKAHPSEVTIRVVGEACSMAAVILQAGDVREATRHSTIMTHIGSTDGSGHKENVKRRLKFEDKLDVILDDIMLVRINAKRRSAGEELATRNWWKKHELFDNFMMADEALELGLLDKIYEPH